MKMRYIVMKATLLARMRLGGAWLDRGRSRAIHARRRYSRRTAGSPKQTAPTIQQFRNFGAIRAQVAVEVHEKLDRIGQERSSSQSGAAPSIRKGARRLANTISRQALKEGRHRFLAFDSFALKRAIRDHAGGGHAEEDEEGCSTAVRVHDR